MKKLFIAIAICGPFVVCGQTFAIKEKNVFKPQNKKVLLYEDSLKQRIITFKTNLYVNTDGTPLSYHPYDLLGKQKAINTIGNAVAIYKGDSKNNLFLNKPTFDEALRVFEKFRDSDYDSIPVGYTIGWKNVLIAEYRNGKEKPCILKSGEYKGYYASATSLKNGLTANKGECECDNQVNSLKVPGLVLVGGKNNIIKKLGAKLGDLVITYNLDNGNLVYAIINDYGPKNNLGEGSVLLNMKLKGAAGFPKTRKEANALSTKNVIVAIIPNSNAFEEAKPYTLENVNDRVTKWLKRAGFESEVEIIDFIKKSASEFD